MGAPVDGLGEEYARIRVHRVDDGLYAVLGVDGASHSHCGSAVSHQVQTTSVVEGVIFSPLGNGLTRDVTRTALASQDGEDVFLVAQVLFRVGPQGADRHSRGEPG